MNTVTHIAGLVVRAFGRTIQRCSLCGEKLCDSRDEEQKTGYATTSPAEMPVWCPGALVQWDDGQWGQLVGVHKLPPDSCFALLESGSPGPLTPEGQENTDAVLLRERRLATGQFVLGDLRIRDPALWQQVLALIPKEMVPV